MPIYKLSPVDKKSHHWKASTFKGDVYVRAENEDRARQIASSKFHVAAVKGPEDESVPSNPWSQGEVVRAEIDGSGRFSDEGEEGIVAEVSVLKRG